jgi:hypothetical protein
MPRSLVLVQPLQLLGLLSVALADGKVLATPCDKKSTSANTEHNQDACCLSTRDNG